MVDWEVLGDLLPLLLILGETEVLLLLLWVGEVELHLVPGLE